MCGSRQAPVAESSGIIMGFAFEEPGEFEALGKFWRMKSVGVFNSIGTSSSSKPDPALGSYSSVGSGASSSDAECRSRSSSWRKSRWLQSY